LYERAHIIRYFLEGAWSRDEKYSLADMSRVVELARLRGIRVELELDMPGHAAAYCSGYPELCAFDKGPNSPGCGAPLDVSKNSTFEFVDGLVGELHEQVRTRT
jgi:hexosaminidase